MLAGELALTIAAVFTGAETRLHQIQVGLGNILRLPDPADWQAGADAQMSPGARLLPTGARARWPGVLLGCLRASRQIRAPVYMQGLADDEPRILGCQKHRGLGDLVRLRHAAERNRARRLDEFRLTAAIARLAVSVSPGAIALTLMRKGASSSAIARVSDRMPPLLAT